MGPLFALTSALCYGLSDFAGGLLARRMSFAAVAFLGQAGALVFVAVVAPLVTPAAPPVPAVAWGALSGVGTGVGMLFLFRGLSRAAMTVVVPISAVSGVALPILIGVLLLGERPSGLSWLGVGIAVPALWLVSTGAGAQGPGSTPGVVNGLIAGGGIALQYVALAQSGPDAGLWPVLAGRVTALGTILPMFLAADLARPSWRAVSACAATGVAAALALACYLVATRHQLVAVAVVLSSLYPVVPVVLGVTVLHERVGRKQCTGLGAAAGAVVLLAV